MFVALTERNWVHRNMKVGVSSEDLQDLFLARLDFVLNTTIAVKAQVKNWG